MTKVSHHESHDSGIKQISTPTQNTLKCSKIQPSISSNLPPKCVEHALWELDDHSPVKPTLNIETKETDDYSDSNIDDIVGLNSEAVKLFQDIDEGHIINPLYKIAEFMEMDGTYVHNIEIPLTFTYSAEPKSICNVNKHNQKGPSGTINEFNCFNDLCVVVSIEN